MQTARLTTPTWPSEFARDVYSGLVRSGQRELPSRYLYDEVGTALFEAITLLPEYGLARADGRLLHTHARAILDSTGGPMLIAELGSGTGRKTRWLLEELAHRQGVMYYPIDISATALNRCRQELSDVPSLGMVGLEASYLDGLRQVASSRPRSWRLLVLFLGSTIGNFEPPAALDFLRQIRGILGPGDALLLGADLVKPVPELLRAYDDPAGITAAFNLNLLVRVNRELGADIDIRAFTHEARWVEERSRIEMHIRSLRRQTLSIPRLNATIQLRAGETIWTESCHKFTPDDVLHLGDAAGFRCGGQWIDSEWPFAETLFLVSGPRLAAA
jgi:L-histidine N-alpha-methyltransferase